MSTTSSAAQVGFLYQHPGLSDVERFRAGRLLRLFGRSRFRRSIAAIGAFLGVSGRTVIRLMNKLVDLGILDRRGHGVRCGAHVVRVENSYQFKVLSRVSLAVELPARSVAAVVDKVKVGLDAVRARCVVRPPGAVPPDIAAKGDWYVQKILNL